MIRLAPIVLSLMLATSNTFAQVQMDSMEVDTLQSGLNSNDVFFTRSDSDSTTIHSQIWSYVDTTGGFGGTAEANSRFEYSSSGYPNQVAYVALNAGVDIGLTTTVDANASVTFTITEQLVLDIDLIEDSEFDSLEWIIDVTSEQNYSFCYTDGPQTLYPGTYTVTLSFDESTTGPYRDDSAEAIVHLATPVGDQYLTYESFCPIPDDPDLILPFPGLDGERLVTDGAYAFQIDQFASSTVGDEFIRSHGALRVLKENGNTIEDHGLLIAPIPEADAYFGSSVDAEDGVLVVGSSNEGPDNEGAVYVYRLIDDTWTFEQRLTSPVTENSKYFGRLVGTSNGWLVTTSNYQSAPNLLHIYHYNGTEWEYITSTTPTESTSSYRSLQMHDGLLLLSTYASSQGPRFTGYEMTGDWWEFGEPDFIGEEFYGNGPEVLVHKGQWVVASYFGIVRVYRRTESGLLLQEVMQPPAYVCDEDDFPDQVSIANDRIMLSIDGSHPSSYDEYSNAHFIYEFNGHVFEPLSKIVESDSGFTVGFGLFNDSILRLDYSIGVFSEIHPDSSTLNRGTESGWVLGADLTNMRFGSSIATDKDADAMVVGAYGLQTQGVDTGGVWIYEYDQFNEYEEYWDRSGFISPSSLQAGDYFGLSADIQGRLCAIGALGDDSNGPNSGQVHVFQDFDHNFDWNPEVSLQPDQPSQGAHFGNYVQFSSETENNERSLLVCSRAYDEHAHNAGAVYIFERRNTEPDFELEWAQTHMIVPPDPRPNAYFGQSADWTDELLVIGAYRDDEVASGAGAVYIYQRNGTDWSFVQKLAPSSLSPDAHLGVAVRIDEDRIFVGASNDQTDGVRSGALYIYEYNQGQWTRTHRLHDPDGFNDDAFAQAFDVSGDTLFVGVPGSDELNTDGGGIVAYKFDGQQWVEQPRDDLSWYSSSPPPVNSQIGASVVFDGRNVVIGAPGSDYYGLEQSRGMIYYYQSIDCTHNECNADLTPDGSLNFLDVSAFIAAFSNRDPIADFTRDGQFNFLDLSEFLLQFSQGCP
jgi:hypothetical protein